MNTFDIETFNEDQKVIPYCLSFIVNNHLFSFYYENDKDDIILKSFKKIVEYSTESSITFFIHNINFDGLLILDTLFKNNIIFNIIKRGLNIYSISFEFIGCKFIFKCSYKLIPISLKKLSEEISDSKGSFPYKFACRANLFYIGECPDKGFFENFNDYELFKNRKFDFKKESIKYCEQDVIILKKVLIEIKKSLIEINPKFVNLFNKSYSIPSFSHKIFYKFYNKFNVDKQIKLEIYSYIKKSYYGGRCEIFGNQFDDEITHYFDFSGMYGLCMLEDFPIGENFVSFNNKNINEIGFHYITYKSSNQYPVLPYKKEKKLLFPNGVLKGLYWYEEIKEFISRGGEIIDVEYSILYKKTTPIFKEFVNHFNNIRLLGGYKKILGKLIINSLYGGFGMSDDESFTIITFSEEEFNEILLKTNVKSYVKKGNCILIDILKDNKSSFYFNKDDAKWNTKFHERNIAYASIIASKARIKLYRAFMDVIKDGGRLLYCDTDSIFAAYKEDRSNFKCGDFKWISTYEKSCFILPKFYILLNNNEENIKIKGVRQHNIKANELINKFYQNEKSIIFENELVFYKKNYLLKQKYNEKELWINSYNKRVFDSNKKTTTPILL